MPTTASSIFTIKKWRHPESEITLPIYTEGRAVNSSWLGVETYIYCASLLPPCPEEADYRGAGMGDKAWCWLWVRFTRSLSSWPLAFWESCREDSHFAFQIHSHEYLFQVLRVLALSVLFLTVCVTGAFRTKPYELTFSRLCKMSTSNVIFCFYK